VTKKPRYAVTAVIGMLNVVRRNSLREDFLFDEQRHEIELLRRNDGDAAVQK
jgi:hypothetical protein